jgi:hypothetical protein
MDKRILSSYPNELWFHFYDMKLSPNRNFVKKIEGAPRAIEQTNKKGGPEGPP